MGNNDLIVIKFYDVIKALDDDSKFDGSVIECSQLHSKEKDAFVLTECVYFDEEEDAMPCPRSQSHAWIDYTNDGLWIYGGLNASTEFNDLWCLNLKTMKWQKNEYHKDNILGARSIKSLASHNFKINLN